MAREKDNRLILSAVQLPDQWARERDASGKEQGPPRATGFTEYAPGDEDDLEAAMTPEQCEYLLDCGAIAGDWKAAGKLPAGVEPGASARRNATFRRASAVRKEAEAAKAEGREARPVSGGHVAEPLESRPEFLRQQAEARMNAEMAARQQAEDNAAATEKARARIEKEQAQAEAKATHAAHQHKGPQHPPDSKR
jgi:hypothetical protein